MNTNNSSNSSNSDGPHLPADEVVARAVSAFEAMDRQTMPERPSDAETMSWLNENTKLDVTESKLPNLNPIEGETSCDL